MVFSTTGPAHRHWSIRAVKDDGEIAEVESRRKRAELGFKGTNVMRHLRRDIIKDRRQSLVAIVGADSLFQLFDLELEATMLCLSRGEFHIGN